MEVKAACKEWIKVISVRNRQEIDALQTILDLGEAEVITLGQEIGADLLLINNREPRRFAQSLKLNLLGTIGIIRLAWKKKIIKDPLNHINKLRLKGFWISDSLIKTLKSEIKEK